MAAAGKPLLQPHPSLRVETRIRDNDDGLSAFASVRPRLFSIAYRMLGSAAEAEDVVQDVWLRWQSTNRETVENPPAYMATTTTRLCINLVNSAHMRRETYIGTWLPEPVDTSSDPRIGAERGEALRLAVLMLLEKLSPRERAAYVLREAFDYSYRQIADILQMEEANARQLVVRARKHIAEGRRTPVSLKDQQRLLHAFIAAAQRADMGALEELFAKDVVSTSDSGGIVRAPQVPVVGRERVAKFIATAAHFCNGVKLDWSEANGQAAVVVSRDDAPVALTTIDASAQRIDQILWILPSELPPFQAWARPPMPKHPEHVCSELNTTGLDARPSSLIEEPCQTVLISVIP